MADTKKPWTVAEVREQIDQLRTASAKLILIKGTKDKSREREIADLSTDIADNLAELLPNLVTYYLGEFEDNQETWQERIDRWELLLQDDNIKPPTMDNHNIGLDMLNELFTQVQNAIITVDGIYLEIAKYLEAYTKCYERYEAIIKMAVPDLKVDSSDALAKASLTDEIAGTYTGLTVVSKLFGQRKQTLLAVKQTLSEIAQNHRQAIPYPTGIDPLLGRADRTR
jgi:hypothetical protein